MKFSTKIINWYYKNKRELPWRQEVNPYHIWLSEVILQQTRVKQGLPYYLRFIKNYPTIQDLSKASEERILKDWQGLGYYSRARNLHTAAKTVVKRYGGEFPKTFQEILSLDGIGPYTAAAISSLAFNLPHAVIDGNVQRVISRIFGIEMSVNSTIGKKEIEKILEEIFDKRRPGDFNQAIMEFGAIHCKPQQPLCPECPFELECYARKNNKVGLLPVKEKKTKIKSRYFLYLVLGFEEIEFIRKRTKNDIWKNLYEFPMEELTERLISPNNKMINTLLKGKKWKYKIISISKEYKHVLTHRIIYARFVSLAIQRGFKTQKGWIKKHIYDDGYAVPVLIQKFIDDRADSKV